MKRRTADIYLLFVGILWGLGFVFVKIGLNEGVNPFYLLAIRFLGSLSILYLFFRKKVDRITMYDFKAGIILGIVQFIGFAFQTYGASFTTASNNAFLTAIYVVISPYLFWILYKERPGIFTFLASFLCLMGVGIISFDDNMNLSALNKGDIMTIIGAVFFSVHIVATGYYSERVKTLKLIFIQMFVGGMLFVISMFIHSGITGSKGITPLAGTALIAVLYLTIFSTAIPFFIQTYAQKYTTSTRASLLLSTESLFGPIFAVFMLNEVLSSKIIIGAGLILISVVISEIKLTFNKEKL